MSQLTKGQLQGENQTNFPNNNTNYITPALLRAFNSDMIDSLALQSQVDAVSSSVNGLLVSSSKFATTGSNTFTGNQTISGSNYLDIGTTRIQDTSNGITVFDSNGGLQIRNYGNNDLQLDQNAVGDLTLTNHLLDIHLYTPSGAIFLNDVDFAQYSASVDSRLNNAQGTQGVQGSQGANGTNGTNGVQGIQGLQGIQGIQGAQGRLGQTGPIGIQGIQGITGTQGIIGTGTQGAQGVAGSGSFNSASFATTGSNTFNGNQTIISGAVIIQNNGNNSSLSDTELNIESTGTPAASYIVSFNQTASAAVISYDGATYDNELWTIADSAGIRMTDWDGGTGNLSAVPFISLEANNGSQPAPQFGRGLGVTGSIYQSGTFYADIIDVSVGNIVETTGSYVGTFTSGGILTYDTYQNVATALQPYISGSGGSINTGSFATTGSNTFSGSQIIRSSGGAPLTVDHYDATPTQNTLIGFNKSGSAIWSIGNLGTDDSFVLYNPDTFQSPISVAQNNGVTFIGNITASGNISSSTISGLGNATLFSSSVNNRINSIVTGTGFATTGSNTFVGNQTLSSSKIIFNATGSNNNGLAWNTGGSIYSDNSALNFLGIDAALDFSVGGTTSNDVKFRNTSPSGGVQFTANGGLIRLIAAGNSIEISGSTGTTIQGVNFIPYSASVNSRLLAATGSVIYTGSFAITGSNNFKGNQIISGSLIQSSSNSITTAFGNAVGTLIKNRVEIAGGDGSGGNPTSRLWLTGTDGRLQTLGGSFQSIDTTNCPPGLGAGYIAYTDTGSAANLSLGVYNGTTYEGDTELIVNVDITGTQFKDWDRNINDYSYWLTLGPNDGITIPTPTFSRGLTLSPIGAPTSPTAGTIYFSSADSHFYGWNGSAWKQLDNTI